MTDYLTDEEFFKLHIQNKFTLEFENRIEKIIGNSKDLENKIEKDFTYNATIIEQCYFGRGLIEDILFACKDLGSKKDLIKQIKTLIDESYFEL